MTRRRSRRRWWIAAAVAAGVLAIGGALLYFDEITEYLARGPTRDARRAVEAEAPAPRGADLLILALDGVGRDLLYDLLRAGKMPRLAELLGGLDRAYLDERVLSVMPSSTIPAWASVFTGEPPAVHGMSGNELFVREATHLAAPAPVSFSDHDVIMSIYTDGTAERFLAAPTIYEKMRRTAPHARIWVSMSQFYRGADRILTARRAVLAGAFLAFVEEAAGDRREVYAELDQEALETVEENLDEAGVPDVLTVYFAGPDLYAHQAEIGPDDARRAYLAEVLDPQLGALREALARAGALDDRYVVVVSDHGHTAVLHDDAHALGTEGDDEPPAVLRAAGFRLRDFDYHTGGEYDTVMAYGGATAFVYLADRSACAGECDWTRPPRYREDVLAAAEALHRANLDDTGPLAGKLDLILVREPRPFPEIDEPFSVYAGGGRVEPIDDHLARHPRPGYVAVAQRLADLAAGPRGERAGDLLLIARNGDEARPEDRYYFSREYRSWHGSPAREDSEVAFIVAHPRKSSRELGALVAPHLGDAPRLQHVGRAILALFESGDHN